MSVKKISAAVMAAAETQMLTVTEADLLKQWDVKGKTPSIKYLNDGWFILYSQVEKDIDVRILGIDIDKWRSTGKVEYIKCEKAIARNWGIGGSDMIVDLKFGGIVF